MIYRTLTAAFPHVSAASVVDYDYTDAQGEPRHAWFSGTDAYARAARGLEAIRCRGGRSITATVTWADSTAQARLDDAD